MFGFSPFSKVPLSTLPVGTIIVLRSVPIEIRGGEVIVLKNIPVVTGQVVSALYVSARSFLRVLMLTFMPFGICLIYLSTIIQIILRVQRSFWQFTAWIN